MVLYPNKLPESERVCSGICRPSEGVWKMGRNRAVVETESTARFRLIE